VSVVASLRFISLGKVILQGTPTLQLTGDYTRTPFSLGILYLF